MLPLSRYASLQHAPVYAGRVLISAAETGLRTGDLRDLTRSDLEQTAAGQTRIILRTRKSNRRNYASIPVTPRLKVMIDALPDAQHHILVRDDGQPFNTANALGALVHAWHDRIGLCKDLHFYDCRGTAVTRLAQPLVDERLDEAKLDQIQALDACYSRPVCDLLRKVYHGGKGAPT